MPRRLSPTALILSATLPALACAPAEEERPRFGDFPDEFDFGVGLSAFEVNPGCPRIPAELCEDRRSDWYHWVTDPDLVDQPGNFLSGDDLGDGSGHYELYDDDFQRAASELSADAVRVSLEWSRLFPQEPVGVSSAEELAQWADPVAVAATRDYLERIRDTGLRPLVSISDRTLPVWLHDPRACHSDLATCADAGWLDGERAVREAALFAGWAAMTYGDVVRDWVTLDDPVGVALSGYLFPGADRSSPPGVIDPDAAVAVLFHQLEAHGRMVRELRAHDPDARVGVSLSLVSVRPDDPDRPEDVASAAHAARIRNDVALAALLDGSLDLDLDGTPDAWRPGWAPPLDFVGVDYGGQVAVRALGYTPFPDWPLFDFHPLDPVRGEHPDGLTEILHQLDARGASVVVTRLSTLDVDGAGDRFVLPHLQRVAEALADGVDVQGVYLWSLVDGYARNQGLGVTEGLFAVDPTTRRRSLREHGELYGTIARTRAIPTRPD